MPPIICMEKYTSDKLGPYRQRMKENTLRSFKGQYRILEYSGYTYPFHIEVYKKFLCFSWWKFCTQHESLDEAFKVINEYKAEKNPAKVVYIEDEYVRTSKSMGF